MEIALIVILAIVLVVVIYLIATYNGFKKLEVRIKASLQEVGNQLQRLTDLLPNLEGTVGASAAHESGIFASLAAGRAGINAAMKSTTGANLKEASTGLTGLLSGLRMIGESNPELKANQQFGQLFDEITNSSNKLEMARRLLIDLTAKYNEKLSVFPSNLVGKMFGFTEKKGFDTPESGDHVQLDSDETSMPKVFASHQEQVQTGGAPLHKNQ